MAVTGEELTIKHLLHRKVIIQENDHLKKQASYASVTVAATLIIIKIFAWIHTNSISILSTLTDSVLDLGASAMNLLAVYHAMRPPNAEYKFGRDKLESLGAIGQSILLFISGSFIFKASLDRLLHPEPLKNPELGIGILVFSLIITFALVIFQRIAIQRTKSLALVADSAHYRSDLFLNVGGLVAIGLYMWLGWVFFDSLVGCAVAFYIFYAAHKIIQRSFRILLDAEIPLEERQAIFKVLQSHPHVKKVDCYKTRTSGSKLFICAHIYLTEKTNVSDAYKIIKSLEKTVEKIYPFSEILLCPKPYKISK